jgi:superoxide dismutase, Cu-Zn family
MRKMIGTAIAATVLVWTGTACGSGEDAVNATAAVGAKRSVELIGTGGEKIGRAELTQMSKGVHIRLEASNLVPGKHGFHIHESGACETPDFKSAGAHFNPTNKKHGFENPKGVHAGDLPNLFVGTEGNVTAEMVAKNVTLEDGKPSSLLKPGGTSLIIHSGPDDYKTDPAGNSGGRVACGRIQ